MTFVPALAGTLRSSMGNGSAGDSWDEAGHVVETAACLTAREGKGPDSDATTTLIPQVAHTLTGEGFDASEDGTGRGTPLVPQPIGFDRYNNASTGDVAHTLAAGKGYPDVMPHVLDAVHQPAYGMTGGTGDESAFPEQQPALTAHETGQGWWNEADHAGTLRAEGENRPSRPSNVAVTAYGVRRLTPTECERLQGFPDGWTEPAGSDSARYKELGNAVTVNVPQWLFRRMLETA